MPGRREDLFLNPPIFAIRDPKKSHANRKAHQSARKFHLRRLNDIVHLCVQRGDLVRAKAAFAILARCREIEWVDMWRTGLAVVGADNGKDSGQLMNNSDSASANARVVYLKAVILESKIARVEAMKELLLTWISIGEYQKARDYLAEDYLTTYPFHDSTVLQTYGGLISLYLAHEIGTTQNTLSQSLLQQNRSAASLNKNHLRAAKDYFEQALRLDKSNHVARSFIEKLMPQFHAYGLKLGIDLSNPNATVGAPNESDTQKAAGPSKSEGMRVADAESEEEEEEPSWARSSSEDSDDNDRIAGSSDEDDRNEALESKRTETQRSMVDDDTEGEDEVPSHATRQSPAGSPSPSLSLAPLSLSTAPQKFTQPGTQAQNHPANDIGPSSVPRSHPNLHSRPRSHRSSSRHSHQSTTPTAHRTNTQRALQQRTHLSTSASPSPSYSQFHPDPQNEGLRASRNASRVPSPIPPESARISTHPGPTLQGRRSFAQLNAAASPELIDNTVYIEDESVYYGATSPIRESTVPSDASNPMHDGQRSSQESSVASRFHSPMHIDAVTGDAMENPGGDTDMDDEPSWAQ